MDESRAGCLWIYIKNRLMVFCFIVADEGAGVYVRTRVEDYDNGSDYADYKGKTFMKAGDLEIADEMVRDSNASSQLLTLKRNLDIRRKPLNSCERIVKVSGLLGALVLLQGPCKFVFCFALLLLLI